LGIKIEDQGRHGQFLAGKAATVQWWQHQRRAAAANFYSAKGVLASCEGPEDDFCLKVTRFKRNFEMVTKIGPIFT
jgi:hypothetical protein